jgi:hypothetical protein
LFFNHEDKEKEREKLGYQFAFILSFLCIVYQ